MSNRTFVSAPSFPRAAFCLLAAFTAGTASAAPAVLYTDLEYAPVGAFVTVFGRDLGSAAVVGADVVSKSSTKVVLTWKGTTTTIGGIPVPVTTRAGTIREATPSTLSNVCSAAQSGDVIYLRGGTYTARCGVTTWSTRQFNIGSKFSDVAFVGYPGETASIKDVLMTDGVGQANNVTFANLKMAGTDCVFGASWWESDESGAKGGRLVNNECFGNYGSQNTMTGLVAFGGDGWRVIGNSFSNNAPSPINNNHAVYVNVGADDAIIAYNRFTNMKMGHVIQIHTDGPARDYQNIRIHDNELIGTNPQDMRGLNVSGCSSSSTVDIYNNVLLNLGQDFSGITVYCGNVQIRHNTLANIAAAVINKVGGTVTARNNVMIGRANVGSFTQSDNVTSGTVDSTGHLLNAPTAPNVGINVDHDGQARGTTVTVGAYEGSAAIAPLPPTALTIQ